MLMHPQKSYDAIMFQSEKSQKISRNTNVHNSDVLNTIQVRVQVLIIVSISMESDIYSNTEKKSQHD